MKVLKAVLGVLLLSLVLFQTTVSAQSGDSAKVKLRIKGFIKADAIFDSRQTVSARESFVLMYPKKPLFDKNGFDLNNRPQYNQYGTSSRLIFTVDTLKYHDYNISAYVETDFTGASDATNSGLRMRHGYLKIDHKQMQLLIGQYWHPLAAPEAFPDMLSLNLGNPIKSAMRAPQVRFQYRVHAFDFVAVASAHRDNSSIGPSGIVPDYLKNQVIPGLHLQTIYHKNNFLLGAGYDFKRLNMRTKTDSNVAVNEYVSSSAVHVFGKLELPKMVIKAQCIWGENLYDQAMLGGVGVTAIDSLTQTQSYAPIAQASMWVNVATKFPKFNVSLFAGYTQNLGSETAFVGSIYARGNDIAYIYRIAPQLSYKMGKVILFSETEYTVAAYGIPDKYCKVSSSKETGNLRQNLSLLFLF
jgi:hypothetical protein